MRQVSGPKDIPWVRHSLIEGSDPAMLDDRLTNFQMQNLLPIIREHAVLMTSGLQRAELYWVTKAMTELALDAAIDIPEWSVESARPSPSGVIWWAGPLPPINRGIRSNDAAFKTWRGEPNVRSGAFVRPTGAMWWTIPASRTTRVAKPQLGLALLARATDVDEDAPAEAAAMPVWNTSIPLTGPPVPAEHQPEVTGVVALLGATWRMMMEPKVASITTIEQARKDRERAGRADISTSDITTIDLRTIRHIDTAPEQDQSGRHLTVRHYVRGHWRQQWMHSSSTHEPRYIAPYIKGPQDAPLKVRERVMVWRR